MTNSDDMKDTMNEIDMQDQPVVSVNMRESLKSDIKSLERDIKDAQETADRSDEDAPSHTPISPEQANESKKNIVFLKKDLAQKKSQFEQLDS
jgi:hypothetical protein